MPGQEHSWCNGSNKKTMTLKKLYMPSDFEKQVRQKMEELDFVPGEPVWTKIEEQIRRKKDRRKLAFWLPLFLLLAGGSTLWLMQGQHRNEQSAQQVVT